MTLALPHWRLLAYDVRDPRRLRRVHKALARRTLFVQESVAVCLATETELAQTLAVARDVLSPADDLCAWTVTDPARMRWIGRGIPPELAGNFPVQMFRPGAGQPAAALPPAAGWG